MIGIVDYGLGNLLSVYNAFKYIGIEVAILSKPEELAVTNAIVLPGVGHFSEGMHNLKKLNLINALHEQIMIEKKPVLGICLGMQLMTSFSEEGRCDGLGWLKCRTKKLHSSILKTPNMGWSEVVKNNNSVILAGMNNPNFYFVHSYYIQGNSQYTTSYIDVDVKVASSIENNNIFAVQFHPEKSQYDGIKCLKNFMEL